MSVAFLLTMLLRTLKKNQHALLRHVDFYVLLKLLVLAYFELYLEPTFKGVSSYERLYVKDNTDTVVPSFLSWLWRKCIIFHVKLNIRFLHR